MAEQNNELSGNAKENFQILETTLEKYAVDPTDGQLMDRVMNSTIELVNTHSTDEDKELAIQSYNLAYTLLGESKPEPEKFEEEATKIATDIQEMLNRKFSGNFKDAENDNNEISNGAFLQHVTQIVSTMVDRTADDLPGSVSFRTAMDVFADDNANATEQTMQLIKENKKANPEGEAANALSTLANNIQKQTSQDRDNHLQAAKIFASSNDPEKAILPLTVYSANHGSEENRDDLRKVMSDNEKNLSNAVTAGIQQIMDKMESSIAKESMFNIAIVPLPPKQDDETEGTKEETKFVLLTKMIDDLHNNYQGDDKETMIQAAINVALVPLTHSSGEKVTAPLTEVFKYIDENEDYRLKVIEEIPTHLPSNLLDMLYGTANEQMLSPGQMTVGLDNLEMDGRVKNVMQKIQYHQNEAISRMEPSEEMQTAAEYLMVNAMVTLSNAMEKPNSLTTFHNNDGYYGIANDTKHPDLSSMGGMVKVADVVPELNQAIDVYTNLSKTFLLPSDDPKKLELRPMFTNTDSRLQEQLKNAVNKAGFHLGALLPDLQGHMNKMLTEKKATEIANTPVPKVVRSNRPKN